MLELFLGVARRGSFAAAARERGLDPSSVSRSIAALEQELGARLFQRTTRTLSLTEAGERYLQRVEFLIEDLGQAREEALSVTSRPSGTLRFTTSVAFGEMCVVPLLRPFRSAFPALKLELILADHNLDLVAERMDLAIRLAPGLSGAVVGAKLMDTRYRVCASPGYLASAPPLHAPAMLADHHCLVFTLPEYRSRWLFRDRAGAVSEVPIKADMAISNALALRHATLAGLGPALLADWLIGADIADGRLVDVFPDYDATATTFGTAAWFVYPSRAFLPHKVRVTIDFLREGLKPRSG